MRRFWLLAPLFLAACPSAGLNPPAFPRSPASATPPPIAVPEGAVLVKAEKSVRVNLPAQSIAIANGHAVVGWTGSGQVTAIDVKTGEVTASFTVGGSTTFLGAFEDGRHVLALDGTFGTARVLDPVGDHVLQLVHLGGMPTFAVLSPDNPTVLVARAGEPKAALLTFEKDRSKTPKLQDFAVGAHGAGPRTLGYDHDWVVVPNAADNTVSLFDMTKGEVKTVPGGGKTLGEAHMGVWGGVARHGMVANDNGLSLFAIPSGERTDLPDLGKEPSDLQGEENLRRCYIAMKGSNELVVVDYDKQRLFGRVAVGKAPSTIAIVESRVPPKAGYTLTHEEDNNPREVWVGNGDGTMTVVDANTLRVMAVVQVGQGPHRVAFTDDKAFVTNAGDDTVSVVDRSPIK